MNLKQTIAIAIAVLGVLGASAAQLTDLIGPGATKAVVSMATLLNSVLGVTLGVITSQSGTIKDVQAMTGVEKITVNAQANSTLATMAVGPGNDKIEPAPGAAAAIQQTIRDAA